MRYLRIISIFFIVAMAGLALMGCKQRQATEKPQTPIFDAKKADWVRIDLQDANAPVQGFIDTKTYKPLPELKANFWHKLATEKEAVISHLLLDCQSKKYMILARLTYDGKGNLTSQTTTKSDWQNIIPESNTEVLCMTLAPTGKDLIQKEDLPIIRNLMLKGIRKSK